MYLVVKMHTPLMIEHTFKEVLMSRMFASFAIALVCVVTLHAQETTTTTKTEVKGKDAKIVTYAGCLQTGAEPRSFVLAKVMPVDRTTTTEVGTSGTTTTSYVLVPGENVELQQHVGHKVEVTGVMIPAGESKTETKTKIERENPPDTTIKERVKTDDAMPQFRVISIKSVTENCS